MPGLAAECRVIVVPVLARGLDRWSSQRLHGGPGGAGATALVTYLRGASAGGHQGAGGRRGREHGCRARSSLRREAARAHRLARWLRGVAWCHNTLAVLGAAVLHSMPSNLEMSMIMAVLQSTPSTLEICACIALVDGSETKNIQQIMNSVTILFLALCDWHVPDDTRV